MKKSPCKWPSGTCACYVMVANSTDPHGRVWMHCEEGLSMTKASMSRFVMHCLRENIEIGDIRPFDHRWDRCQVSASVRLRTDQFDEFESATGGKLREPPRISINSSDPGDLNA